MAYSTALPYERPAKLSAWEIPFAVAGALVDCLTCGVRCGGDIPASEETYWPAAVPPHAVPKHNAGRSYLSGDNFETKAVFTNIPLREEAMRRGYVQPAEGESLYTTVYKPPLGPPVRLVPVEAAGGASDTPVQTSLQQRLSADPASVADAAFQADVEAARTAEAPQEAFVAAGTAATPAVAVVPPYFNETLRPALTAAAGNEILRSPYETMYLTSPQQGTGPLHQHMVRRQENAVAAYQSLYVPPVIPRTYEVYLPSRSWAPAATKQRRYVCAARTPTVSQAVQTAFEEEDKRDTRMGKTGSALMSGTDVAGSEKDTSPTDRTLSEGGSTGNAAGRKQIIKEEHRKGKNNADEKDGCEAVEEKKDRGGGEEEGKGGEQQKTTPPGTTGGQPSHKGPLPPTEERLITNTSVSDQFVFHQKEVECLPAANRCVVGFVPPVPPQQYKRIYVGGRPYLQGGVFYLSDTGAYLLGI